MNEEPRASFSDHDLLIRLDTRMEDVTRIFTALKEEIKEIKKDKLERSEFTEKNEDFQRAFNAIRSEIVNTTKVATFARNMVYVGMGAIAALQVAVPFIWKGLEQ